MRLSEMYLVCHGAHKRQTINSVHCHFAARVVLIPFSGAILNSLICCSDFDKLAAAAQGGGVDRMKTQTDLTSKTGKSQMRFGYTETDIVLNKRTDVKRAVIRWTVYWLLVLGIYIAISLVFDSLTITNPDLQ